MQHRFLFPGDSWPFHLILVTLYPLTSPASMYHVAQHSSLRLPGLSFLLSSTSISQKILFIQSPTLTSTLSDIDRISYDRLHKTNVHTKIRHPRQQNCCPSKGVPYFCEPIYKLNSVLVLFARRDKAADINTKSLRNSHAIFNICSEEVADHAKLGLFWSLT